MSEERLTRREIIKKAAYVAPVILTFPANFSVASAGSGNYEYEAAERNNPNNNNNNANNNNNNNQNNGPNGPRP